MQVVDVLRIGQQIASGLAAAHAAHLIHRDIKPSNIILTTGLSERAKITDFGLARAVDDANMTRSGMIAGTPMYMAPEQARGETLDHRADLFSLGSVLYQMTSGRPPFRAINTIAVLKRVCEDTPRPLDDVIPETPKWLQSIIFHLLEKDRENRFQSAQEVADLLARCQRELEHHGKVVSVSLPCSVVSSGVANNERTKATWSRGLWVVLLCTLTVLLPMVIGPRLKHWFETPNPTLPTSVTTTGRDGDKPVQSLLNGNVKIIPPAVAEHEADVAIVFLEGNRRIHDRPDHGVEVHVIVKGGEQIIQHAQRMDFDFLKRNTLLDPYFAHGWWENAFTEWSDFRAIHFPSGVTSRDPIWGVRTNRANSLIGPIIIATGSDDKNPFFEVKSDRMEATRDGMRIRLSTNDHEVELGVANGSIYLSDRGWLELEWMGEKESLINSHKTYYLSAGATLLDLGLRPGTSHTWEDEVFGTVKLLIQPGAEAERPKTPNPNSNATSSSTDVSAKATWHHWPVDAPMPAIAPFDSEQAKAHQEAWAEYIERPVEYENVIGMKFRLIPPGEFLMGSTPAQIEAALKVFAYNEWRENIASESPHHKVVLTKPVYFGVTEVTQTQYEQIMGINPALFSTTGRAKEIVSGMDTSNFPVDTVSWNDAAEFCARLSQKEGLQPYDFHSSAAPSSQKGTGYRLATDAEWEFACRAGTSTLFWSGDEDQDVTLVGWIRQNASNRTHTAGELEANPFGLFDVHGNVYEWVLDSWEPEFYSSFQQNAATDPFCSGLNSRLFRGGNANSSPSDCRAAFRLSLDASRRPDYVGLRIVLPVDAAKKTQ